MWGIFVKCSPLSALFQRDPCWTVALIFRICFFFNFYSNGGGSWYQNSVKACLTIGGLVGRFWSPLKFPTFLPPSFKLSVGREELRNGHFHEDAETFGDRIRLSVILRNINQRDIRRDAFQDTHTLRPAKNWKSSNGKYTSPTCLLKYLSDIRQQKFLSKTYTGGFNSAYNCHINYSIKDIASDSNCDNGYGDDYDDDGDDIVGVQ